MSLLSSVVTDDNVQTEEDVLMSSGPLESGIYPCTVSMAYLKKVDSGALFVVLHLKTDTGREIRQDLCIASGDAKGNKNYFEKDGEKKFLPGFNIMESLCLLTAKKPLSAMAEEEKLVNVYDFEAKAEVAKKVPVLIDLIDKPCYAGVIKQTVDKKQKGDDGEYHPTGDVRDENELDKIFRAEDRFTTAEIRGRAETATFFDRWSEKWTGFTRDRTSKKGAADTGAGTSKALAVAGATAKPTESLFG